MSPNERLRAQLERSDHTAASLAEKVGADPKTVARWISTGRVPHRRNAYAVAQILGADVHDLWPSLRDGAESAEGAATELEAVYRKRSDLSIDVWRSMFVSAEESIDILVYAALFLHEQISDWHQLLKDRAGHGVRVRVLIADPYCDAVRVRGEEECFGHGIESRCLLAAMHYRPLLGVAGIDVGLHATTLYNSVYRADGHMFVNSHLYGVNAYGNPLLRLRRKGSDGLFDAYAASMDAVWRTARPLKE
ncbi:XRE family transcriptional regulator [Nocardiopsis sp. NPDC007018]|uniref:XRE family transcriptional regulator n=1 Tax=Nocardiopsis sp. NPDC007018 TaxID=3155721 RepID=UPI0033FCCC91